MTSSQEIGYDESVSYEHCNIHGDITSPSITTTIILETSTITSKRKFDRWRCLGKGNCGSVWTQGDASWVIKRKDTLSARYLWKEYYIQERVSSVLGSNDGVHIPAPFWYISAKDAWRFPEFGEQPCLSMCSERIPPLSRSFRDKLIDHAIPTHSEEAKKLDTDCIARVYLGRRRFGNTSRSYSLKNLPLWLNVLEDLELPIKQYAEKMAEALAVCHWAAEIDANDIEFVLGSLRQLIPTPNPRLHDTTIALLRYNTSTRHQAQPESEVELNMDDNSSDHEVWLLDFDCCDAITMDAAGAEKAAVAALVNDAYIPRPCEPSAPDFELWKAFRERYLVVGAEIAQRRRLSRELPETFIRKLEVLQEDKVLLNEMKGMFPRGPFCAPLSQLID